MKICYPSPEPSLKNKISVRLGNMIETDTDSLTTHAYGRPNWFHGCYVYAYVAMGLKIYDQQRETSQDLDRKVSQNGINIRPSVNTASLSEEGGLWMIYPCSG